MESLVGILLPPLVEWFNQDVHSDEERFLVAVITCFVASCIIKWDAIVSGNGKDLFATFLLVLGETIATFNLYWKNSFLRDRMQESLGVRNTNSRG